MSDYTFNYDDSLDKVSEASVKDYISLLKPRVMMLVVFTAMIGMAMAPGFSDMHPMLIAFSIICITFGAGSAGAINMWYERETDALMTRTKNRPIPTGKIHHADALAFGVILTVASVGLMGVGINWASAFLLGFASFFYVVIYTIWLKKRTPQNIVIGGAAGAFPPMIGWAAVTGSVSIESIFMFALIFMWTPPHFWALALYKSSDYKKAGIPMMPAVAGEKSTKIQMLIYTLLLLPLSMAPYFMGMVNVYYLALAGILNLIFIGYAVMVLRDSTYKSAKSMFAYSIFYLFAMFSILLMTSI